MKCKERQKGLDFSDGAKSRKNTGRKNMQNLNSLAKRIRDGKTWLEANYDHPKYSDALKLYEQLVDKLRELGGHEKDCWVIPTNKEIDEIFGIDNRTVK